MPVRVRAIPPGEFIRNHLRDVGGVDFVQNIHKAYKAYLLANGLKNGTSRETMSAYIWRAKQLGLIVFDHAEAPAYWDAVIAGVRVTRAYRPEGRPRAPSPRHYYRIVDPNDPRWIRLEASYRESIGIPVRPAFPRVPYVPGPPPVTMPPEVTPPPVEVAPPVAPAPRVRRPRAARPARPPQPSPEEVAAPFEARIQTVLQGLDQLERTPTLELVGVIDEEMLDIAEDLVSLLEGARPAVRDRLGAINRELRNALHDIDLLSASVRTYMTERLPARKARAQTALQAAIRVVREDLTTSGE